MSRMCQREGLGEMDAVVEGLKRILGDDFKVGSTYRVTSVKAHHILGVLSANGLQVPREVFKRKFNLNDLISRYGNSEMLSQGFDESAKYGHKTDVEKPDRSIVHRGVGIDIQSVQDIYPGALPVDLKSDEFLCQMFSYKELSCVGYSSNIRESLAGLWAAKEAVFKASNGKVEFADIEIRHLKDGRPVVDDFELSISHDAGIATAIALPKKLEKGRCNVFLYADSNCMRRPWQPNDPGFTYPFRLLTNSRLYGLCFNIFHRGVGGNRLKTIPKAMKTDSGYIVSAEGTIPNIAIIQAGIVDAGRIHRNLLRLIPLASLPYFFREITVGLRKKMASSSLRKCLIEISLLQNETVFDKIFILSLPENSKSDVPQSTVNFVQSLISDVFSSENILKVNGKPSYFCDYDHLSEDGHVYYSDLILNKLLTYRNK
ncbi:4'-phosphopantetheinyl transferase superfamily protein [Amylibacter sp.]|nr:4'-phosphopantetheinyl transferase superfamily protein [Amylibacter sp.]